MSAEAVTPVALAVPSGERPSRAPYLLVLPALLLFVGIVLIPIAMTVLLSFHDWGQYKGIEPVLILKNWKEIWSDGYFHEMFLRTFRIAVLITLLTALLGAPEAYILSRMRNPWRGIFLLVRARAAADLGRGAHARLGAPVRRLERRRQQGTDEPRADLRAAALHVHGDRRRHRAGPRPDAVHGAVGVGRAAAPRPADRERRRLARRQPS